MDSERFGRIQASFRVNGTRVRGFVTVEQKENLEDFRQVLDGFEKDLEESGFTMDGNSLIAGSRSSLHIGDRAPGAKNRDLYQVAKCFVVNAARKEDEE